ncbi:MAG: formate dehydrogenase subunit gamma [Arenicellales bacterium]|nr:formate dehydrogenase subunit gamma [Arenicellales bacterium]
MKTCRFWILLVGLACLPLAGLFFGTQALAETTAPAAINNPNPGIELWQAVRGKLDSPTATQVRGHDSSVLVNPQGELWKSIRNSRLIPQGGQALLVVLLIILGVYAVRGPVKLASGESGQQVDRHSVSSRIIHWLVAGLFIILGITGLFLLLGRPLLIPVIGKTAFGGIAGASKEVHNILGLLFPFALIFMFVNLVRRNLYEKGDLAWVAKGGGMLGGGHVSAGKFNAGEKILFWATIFLGIGISVTGYVLDFPNIASWVLATSTEFTQYRHVMGYAHVIHSVIAVLFIALAFGHIFLATLFVPGTLSSMTSGKVDSNWAKEHHDRWYEEIRNKSSGDNADP